MTIKHDAATEAARGTAEKVLAQRPPEDFHDRRDDREMERCILATAWWRLHAIELAHTVKKLVDAGYLVFDKLAADALADEVDALIKRRVIDTRAPAADALLSYRDPPRTTRSSLLRQSRYKYLVVIGRELVTSAIGFDDLDLAAQYADDTGAQWSDTFLCEVIRGPVV